MPARYWMLLVLSLLAGIAVLRARPSGHPKQKSSEPWRGRIKPPPPPPIPPG